MRITIAVPWTHPQTREHHEAGSSPDNIEDGYAKQLIRDGWARPYRESDAAEVGEGDPDTGPAPSADDEGPQPPPRTGKGSGLVPWVDYASARGVAVPEGSTRAEIIAALEDAGVPTGAAADDDDPDTGDDEDEE